MTVLIVILNPRPEGAIELETVLRAMCESVRDEPGTLDYRLHRDANGNYVLYERYADQAALDAHMDSPRLQVLLARFEDLLAAPPHVTRCAPIAARGETI